MTTRADVTMRALLLLSAAGLVASVLAGCASTPPEEDPVQIKLKDLDTRLTRIEKVTSNQSLLQISNQLEALRADVRAMHNDVDVLSNSLEASRKQSRDLYADLDLRVKNLEARGAGAAAAATGAGAAGTARNAAPSPSSGGADQPSANPDDAPRYQAAFNLLKDGQYDKAIDAFQKFLSDFPASSLADNAQYWLGEAYYVNRNYPDAESAFQRVVEKYPQSRKLPDALLKIGYCRYELKQWDSAKTVLTQVVTQFADSPAGRLAQQRLEKMAIEKH
ncbi:MAG TPA: tol-pal system protein YbgF [Steroidobacteraceae bacterium]|nr:tol-pal system protein YbgF [Steroidobacteraceae bacterium]